MTRPWDAGRCVRVVADGRRGREDSGRGRVSGELLVAPPEIPEEVGPPKTAGRGRRERNGQADDGSGCAEEGEASRGAGGAVREVAPILRAGCGSSSWCLCLICCFVFVVCSVCVSEVVREMVVGFSTVPESQLACG